MIIVIWILFVVSLAAIVFIVVRKFPLLANIDIGQIEAERQAELKRKILSDKFKRNLIKISQQLAKVLGPLAKALGRLFKLGYDHLVNLKASYAHGEGVEGEDLEKKIAVLFAEAEELTHQEDLVKAESKYIEIIGLDSKNFKAFELLGENYLNRQNYHEAEQTFEHAIKLREQLKKSSPETAELDLAKTHYNLSLVYCKTNSWPAAFGKLKQALELEPSNPRYLDKMIEVCIMMKDAVLARQMCVKLEETNPGNKKLKELKNKIRELEKHLAAASAESSRLHQDSGGQVGELKEIAVQTAAQAEIKPEDKNSDIPPV